MEPQDILCIEQIENPDILDKWFLKIVNLIEPWVSILNEDTQPSIQEKKTLYGNLVQQLPYIWIIYNSKLEIAAGVSLTQVIPLRHAFIHGVKNSSYRKYPALSLLKEMIFEEAFENLHLYKLKAEFESDNLGALGFCRMHGFVKEAHFKADNLIQGQRKDVVVYSLFYPTYLERKMRNIASNKKIKRRL